MHSQHTHAKELSGYGPQEPRWRTLARRLGAGLLLIAGLAATSQAASRPLTVVATFSVLADMVRVVGAEQVQVRSLVPPETDAHSFEPRPNDVKTLAQANLLVSNGLGFESWLPGLQQAAGFQGPVVVASDGARLLKTGENNGHDHDHGAIDPHAWQDLRNGVHYVQAIAQGLALADPDHALIYRQRADAYTAQLEQLDAQVRARFSAIPPEHRTIITSHDAFGYFARAYGVKFVAIAGVSGRAEVSARNLAALIDQVRNTPVAGIFVQSGAGSQLVQQLARETGAAVGGELYADALAKPGKPADTYLGMMRWNTQQLLQVMPQP
jgi:zinc/manganese transport system substrate-binding protein